MAKKTLALTLVLHKPFIKHLDGDEALKNSSLFSSISDSYLPLLNVFSNLEAEGIPFKVNMVISPTLCEMLADPTIQQQYIEWLDKLIALGNAEVARYEGNSKKRLLAVEALNKVIQNKRDFQEVFNQDILSKFSYYAKKGNIEFMATAATNAILPLYADFPEAIRAQVEVGLKTHKEYFDLAPDGFYLPYMGYYSGVERILRSYGFDYTIVDTHGFLFSNPKPEFGVFVPARCDNSLAVFANDYEKNFEYSSNSVYKDTEKDIVFEDSIEDLSKYLGKLAYRIPTGFCYYSKSEDSLYVPEAAQKQAAEDAKHFYMHKAERLSKAQELLQDKDVSLSCVYDVDSLGKDWKEGMTFLEEFFRFAANSDDMCVDFSSEIIKENQFSLQKIKPLMTSNSETGYGESLLDNSNSWMLRYVRKATERMIDLSARFCDDTGLKARALNLAAKEVLLAQSGDWPTMCFDKNDAEYATMRFKESVLAFSTVYDSLGSNSISTEWLTRMEKKHTLFKEINYMVFSEKK